MIDIGMDNSKTIDIFRSNKKGLRPSFQEYKFSVITIRSNTWQS